MKFGKPTNFAWQRFAPILQEVAVIATGGVLFALAANAISPKGLNPITLGTTITNKADASPLLALGALSQSSKSNTAEQILEIITNRLAQKGLKWIRLESVTNLLLSTKQSASEGVVVIDARSEKHYEQGHIPGAISFNPYKFEAHLGDVITACANARKILVYCEAITCDDSEAAATLLIQSSIPPSKIYIVPEGFEAWKAMNLPIETGLKVDTAAQSK